MIGIDSETSHPSDRIRKILLSDGKWYTLYDSEANCVFDQVEIGFNKDNGKWLCQLEVGFGVDFQLEDGSTIVAPISEIKAISRDI